MSDKLDTERRAVLVDESISLRFTVSNPVYPLIKEVRETEDASVAFALLLTKTWVSIAILPQTNNVFKYVLGRVV